MSHSEHSSSEKKPVAFTVPFILASVTVVVILLFLSLCDPKPHHSKCECKEDCSKECMEACESGDHSKHGEANMHGKEHKMHCEACKGECTDACMEDCKKGEHEKHGHHGAHAAESPAPATEASTTSAQEAAPAH